MCSLFDASRKLILLHLNESYIVNIQKSANKIPVVLRQGLSNVDLLKAYFHAYFLKMLTISLERLCNKNSNSGEQAMQFRWERWSIWKQFKFDNRYMFDCGFVVIE